MTKSLSILGSTGSIGTSTLSLVDSCPDDFDVKVLVAGSNSALLAQQALKYRPDIVGISSSAEASKLRDALAGSGIDVVDGDAACTDLARRPVDVVVAGIVGLAGLPGVLAALSCGQTVALANKESLVSAGKLAMATARRHGARLLPVDSEHNAIFQCWLGWAGHSNDPSAFAEAGPVDHICLTASGGPFRTRDLESFATISPGEAVKHPNWSMGQKISVDSATMMNKGLEVIEAAWLFNLPPQSIEVMVHPQVAIHGLVYFKDGSVIGQLGTADMKTPISYALAWPERLEWHPEALDLLALGRLDFLPVDPDRYPCFFLARQALAEGGIMPAVLNAANEVAVSAFLDGLIGFTDIASVVSHCLDLAADGDVDSLDAVIAVDNRARELASARCRTIASQMPAGAPIPSGGV